MFLPSRSPKLKLLNDVQILYCNHVPQSTWCSNYGAELLLVRITVTRGAVLNHLSLIYRIQRMVTSSSRLITKSRSLLCESFTVIIYRRFGPELIAVNVPLDSDYVCVRCPNTLTVVRCFLTGFSLFNWFTFRVRFRNPYTEFRSGDIICWRYNNTYKFDLALSSQYLETIEVYIKSTLEFDF